MPIVPEIPGIEDFCGQVLHSKDYDEPEMFAGKKVIVLGARSSGLDITIGIAPFAKQVSFLVLWEFLLAAIFYEVLHGADNPKER